MHSQMIACPYCHATSPADARFCIECSAALQQAATHTTHRLIDSPDLNVKTRICVTHHPATLGHLRIRLAGTILGGILVLLAVLAHRTFRLDIVVLLILIISVVQFVRGTLRGQVITGLRAAVIGVAFLLTMITPWALTICIGAGALLVALHLVDNQRIPSHRRP
jgi:hypothetical protein